jgi:DNA-directed RNA polymerase beta' subunit
MLILNDDLNQLIYLDFEKFIRLKDLDQMILIKKNQWKLIIQYAKINNQIDQLIYLVSTMKIHSNYSDLNRILKQFDLDYLNKEKILKKKILRHLKRIFN